MSEGMRLAVIRFHKDVELNAVTFKTCRETIAIALSDTK